MSLSPIANRSFLHGDKKAAASSEKIVYATLDRLALKRTSLPLQLLPADDASSKKAQLEGDNEVSPVHQDTTGESGTGQRGKDFAECTDVHSDANVYDTVQDPQVTQNKQEIPRETSEQSVLNSTSMADTPEDLCEPREISDEDYERINIPNEREDHLDGYEKISIKETTPSDVKDTSEALTNEVHCPGSIPKKSKSVNCIAAGNSLAIKDGRSESESSTSQEEITFACKTGRFGKNVFQKSSKKSSKKKKSYRVNSSSTSLRRSESCGAMTVSRDEPPRYVTISSPTNFVHLASFTGSKLVSDKTYVGTASERIVITHERKCATLPLLAGANDRHAILNEHFGRSNLCVDGESAYEPVKPTKDVRTKMAKVLLESCQKVKNSSFLWGSRSKRRPEESIDEDYDDVGPSADFTKECGYDDVGPILLSSEGNYIDIAVPANFDEIYDDVVPPVKDDASFEKSKTSDEPESPENESDEDENQYLSIDNEYSSVEDGDDEDDLYDDVGLPSEERVNSLYAGFTPELTPGSVIGSISASGKESEWEDLEESGPALPCPWRRNRACTTYAPVDVQSVLSRRSAQRRSRKVKRQRSKGSRRSSRLFPRIPDSVVHVAVSLGNGSVLLVGNAEKAGGEWKKEEAAALEVPHLKRTQGLVQIRLVDLDEVTDTQEASCYVHEDLGSDESAYETIYSYQDDFSSDSDAEGETESNGAARLNDEAYLEAPTKPTPPPPREASLGQTLSKRIKIFRRTWSITKGSLGRIRRRASADEDHNFENGKASNNGNQLDNGKYFSFRRHFRKSQSTLSTFYLDGDITKNNNDLSSKEPIYGNGEWHNGVQPESGDAAVDHYSVLADREPLYQFYADAAARIAFESDSDGYEEVDVTSAVNLAKPGYRTLWCQTPQVILSGLLQRLTIEERKTQEAKFEILTSEASYLNSLRVLDEEFVKNHELIHEILTPSEREKLFGGVPGVLQASEKFLANLEILWRKDPMLQELAKVLLEYAGSCSDIYVSYCSNQVSMDTTLKELKARKGAKFLETISRIENRPACQSLSLHSFLMLPMQRITRLPLLADAVLSKLPAKHADRSAWERVLSSLSCIVAKCNEGARAASQEAEMEILARKLEYSPKIKPIALRGRQLVKCGPVVQLLTKADTEYKLTFGKRFHKTPLYILLLTDYLLVTKPKCNTPEETYTVIDICKRNFVTLERVLEESPFAGRNAMMLTLLENHAGGQVEYVLTCGSNTEKERWFQAIHPPNAGLLGEMIYETWDCPQVMALYTYSSNQPDELSLQPGDVINVLKKTADGWYHGEKLLDREQGWFPGNHTKEVVSEHVRARNLKQRRRILLLTESILQRRAKQNIAIP